MNRMHPQDLRAKLAMEFYKLTVLANTDDDRTRDQCIQWAVPAADALLAELERTAKPEAPAQVQFCTELDENKEGQQAAAQTTADKVQDLRRSILCRIPAGELEDLKAKNREVCDELDRLVERLQAAESLNGNLRAEVDRLKAELAQAKKDLVMGPCLEVITHEHVAQAVREERERIIAHITDPHNNILWIVPGSSHIHAIHADPRVVRAALEPKPEVPRG